MASPKNIVVVCEGESEWTYLQRLNSALAALPVPEDWVEPPVRFIGRPKKTGVGKGSFKSVERELRKEMKQNPTAEKWAWVDADLYVRDYKDCGGNYRNRAAGIPPFHFSIFNFEDFLALHLDDDGFGRWVEVMTEAGHFKNPLRWDEYKVLFEKIIPGYRKGGLPADFVTLESLGNLSRHLLQMPAAELKDLRVDCTFAASMLDEISRWYAIPGRG